MTHISGASYDGDWAEGNKEGVGTFNFTNGRKYVGEFFNNKLHGNLNAGNSEF